MKKYLLIVLCLFILTGCNKKEEVVDDIQDQEQATEIAPQEEYVDDNPIKVGLYMNGKLVNEYNTTLTNGTDIASFDVYFTNEDDVGSSNTKYNFNRFYNNYENIDNYKIGYFVSFDTNDKHHEVVVKNPDVEFALTPYIYLYLYDDIHQPDGSWYSHVTKDEFNENTILSSIKLYMAEYSEQIVSDITVKVFTYDSDDDFDEDGHYRGISSHTVTIKNS